VTPDCPVCQAEQRSPAQRSADNVNSARTIRVDSEQRQKVHRTVHSDCPVRHRTVRCDTGLSGAPSCQSSNGRNRQNPNDWVMWLAHQTTSGAPIDKSPPQPPLFKASKFLAYCIQYKSSRLHSMTQTRDQILSKVQNHSKHLVTCERDFLVHLSSCRLDRFLLPPLLFSSNL
jgi:hypothetical protein